MITAFATIGEGYHNFHHQFPMDYRNAIRWYQYDPTKWCIWLWKQVGLASNLKTCRRSIIEKGRVQQSNFHDYRMLRIDQAPKIEIHVVKSGEPPGGIGEAGCNGGPPALRNAIYAATGVALRRLPIDRAMIAAGKKA